MISGCEAPVPEHLMDLERLDGGETITQYAARLKEKLEWGNVSAHNRKELVGQGLELSSQSWREE